MKVEVQRAATAVMWLWLGSMIAAALALLTQIVVARQLGPESFGAFAAALATAMILAPLASFGVPGFWLRVFGQEGKGALRWLPASIKLVLASTSVAMALIVAWAIGSDDSNQKAVLLILSVLTVGQLSVDLVSAKLQIEGRYFAMAAWQAMPNAVRLAGLLVMYSFLQGHSVEAVALVYAIVAVGVLVSGAAQLMPMLRGRIDIGSHRESVSVVDADPSIGGAVRQSWVFAASSTLFMVYSQGPVVALKHLLGSQEAGLNGIAFMVLSAASLLPSVVYQKFLQPKVHRWTAHDPARAIEIHRIGGRLMLLSGLIVMLLVWILAPWLIPAAFGDAFKGAVLPTCFLAICIPIRFCSSNQGGFMSSHALMKRKLGAMSVSVVVNAILMLLLVGSVGSMGIVAASIVAEVVLLVLLTKMRSKQVSASTNPRVQTQS